eukprot:1144773-Pelagomonas_calceolata.AAC.1
MGACLGVSATRARVWAAGGVETNMQQIIPNFQACCGCLEGQMDGELKKEQIETLFVGRGAVFGEEGGGWSFWASRREF